MTIQGMHGMIYLMLMSVSVGKETKVRMFGGAGTL